jgi:hypothetical protein
MDLQDWFPRRVPNIPACVPQPGNPATPASLCALSTGRGLEFAQDFCPVTESRQGGAATSRIPFLLTPSRHEKAVCVIPAQISRPTPSRRLGYLARRRCRRPHPLARSRGIHNLGRLVMAEDSQDCHVAGRTHAKKKNMENLEECHCVSARGQDGGQTIRVPSVMTRGRLYTPSHRARGRRNPFGGSCSAATYCRSAKTTGSVAGVETTRSVSMSSSGAVRRAASAPGSRAAANSRRHARARASFDKPAHGSLTPS